MLHLFIRWLQRFLDTLQIAISGGFHRSFARGIVPDPLPDNERGGRKRTIKHALSGANPTNDPDNCIRCVHAWALRRLGYDVVAAPGQYHASRRPPGMTAAEYSTRYWRNHGRTPAWHRSDLPDRGLKWLEIRAVMALEPEGSWGFIRMRLGGKAAHVAAWYIRKGTLLLVDPQSPDSLLEPEMEDSTPGSIRWVNLLGCSPQQDVFNIAEGKEDAH